MHAGLNPGSYVAEIRTCEHGTYVIPSMVYESAGEVLGLHTPNFLSRRDSRGETHATAVDIRMVDGERIGGL